MWQVSFDHPTWTYLTNDLAVGATFTFQLIPEFADNVFLHATVEVIDATVVTPVGTFGNAVRVGYRVDYGWSEDPIYDPGGMFRTEIRGYVHYVPNIGPVDMREEFLPYAETDCGTNECPQHWRDLVAVVAQTMTLSLRGTNVAAASPTWSEIKSLYD
jgi:hypothetical protein